MQDQPQQNMVAGTFGGDIGVIGQYKDESRVSVTDNSANSIYGKGMAPGPDGQLSFQPGGVLSNTNANGHSSSIAGKDNSLY